MFQPITRRLSIRLSILDGTQALEEANDANSGCPAASKASYCVRTVPHAARRCDMAPVPLVRTR